MQMSKKAKNLHRSLFGRFRQFMEYKADKFDKQLILADRYYPSTNAVRNVAMLRLGMIKLVLMVIKNMELGITSMYVMNAVSRLTAIKNAVLNLLALAN